MDYGEKPEASKCGTCRRRGRENYHNKRLRKMENEALVKKRRKRALSPHGFCSMVNMMTKEEDEVIDVQTLIEFATQESDVREFDYFVPEAEAMQQNFPCVEGEDHSVLNDALDDEDLADFSMCCSDVPGSQLFPNFEESLA